MTEYKNFRVEIEKLKTERQYVGFDGLINPEIYQRQKVKTVFLLKDPNGGKNPIDNIDIVKEFKETAENKETPIRFPQMTMNLALWSAIVSKPSASIKEFCSDLRRGEVFLDLDKDMVRGYLSGIGIVNISKRLGVGVNDKSSIDKKIQDSLNDEGEFNLLINQLDEFCPNLIVCGGTFDAISDKYIKNNDDVKVKMLDSGARYFEKRGSVYMEFCHPSRIPYKYAFSHFKEVYNNLKNKKNWG